MANAKKRKTVYSFQRRRKIVIDPVSKDKTITVITKKRKVTFVYQNGRQEHPRRRAVGRAGGFVFKLILVALFWAVVSRRCRGGAQPGLENPIKSGYDDPVPLRQ